MNNFVGACVCVALLFLQTACAVRLLPAPPVAQKATREMLKGLQLVGAMQRGSLVIYFRHAATDRSQHEGTAEDLADCQHQRNLSGRGVDDAMQIGDAMRMLHIPVGWVLSSGYCRTRDTAKIAFGRVDELVPDLTGFPVEEKEHRTQTLKRLLATLPVSGTNTIIVAHGANIASVIIGLSLKEGEAAVFLPNGKSFVLIGRVRPEEWQSLTQQTLVKGKSWHQKN